MLDEVIIQVKFAIEVIIGGGWIACRHGGRETEDEDRTSLDSEGKYCQRQWSYRIGLLQTSPDAVRTAVGLRGSDSIALQ
jgi:hypothetical protein